MLSALIVFAATTFAESKALAVQIHLDRAGFSCNTIDGQWGAKSESALRCYETERAKGLKENREVVEIFKFPVLSIRNHLTRSWY